MPSKKDNGVPLGSLQKSQTQEQCVLMKGEAKDKALWKLGRVVGAVTGKDGAVRGLKLRQGNGYVVERPLQLVCDLEIGGENPDFKLNPEAGVFTPRLGPSRRTKEIAGERIKDIVAQEVKDNESDILVDRHLNGGRVSRMFSLRDLKVDFV